MKTKIKVRKGELEIIHKNGKSQFFKGEILQDFIDDLKNIPTMELNYLFINKKSA